MKKSLRKLLATSVVVSSFLGLAVSNFSFATNDMKEGNVISGYESSSLASLATNQYNIHNVSIDSLNKDLMVFSSEDQGTLNIGEENLLNGQEGICSVLCDSNLYKEHNNSIDLTNQVPLAFFNEDRGSLKYKEGNFESAHESMPLAAPSSNQYKTHSNSIDSTNQGKNAPSNNGGEALAYIEDKIYQREKEITLTVNPGTDLKKLSDQILDSQAQKQMGIQKLRTSYVGNNVTFKVDYSSSDQQVAATDKYVKDWIKANISAKDSTYTKVKKVHDAIGKKTQYYCDQEIYEGVNIYTPEAIVLKGRGACTSYARLFAQFCNELDINSYVVYGYEKKTNYHAWNLVEVDGKWYHLDATWDSPKKKISYNYFLKSDAQMKKERTWTGNYPKAEKNY